MRMTRLVPMLPVRNLPESVAYYEKLGFGVEKRMDDWGWARLRFDDCQIMLDQSIKVASLARESSSVLYLYPEDIKAYHAQVRAAGIDAPELSDTHYGMTEFRLCDPDGNRLWIGEMK